jgi:adenylate cyclase
MSAEAPRTLAAIVSIDIVGYSDLAERDPNQAVAQVSLLREASSAAATANGGRIFNTAGDGVMLEFASASKALACALALCAPSLRIGVHLGEVTRADNGDLLGHGVNVAARLQSEAGAGSILVSQIVRDTATRETADKFVPRGKIRLAKMREMMNVFTLDGSAMDAPLSAKTPLLAVLAFDSLSRDHSTRTLADGLSEEILYAVSRVAGLKVLGATSSFSFRGRQKGKAAKALSATHVLDGSVRCADEHVRVSVHLAEVDTGLMLWSGRFDRALGDVIALQEDIAQEVATALAIAFDEVKRSRQPKLTAALSHQYFEARRLMRSGAVLSNQSAAAALDNIVREAPEFGRAWAALASAKLEVLRLTRTDRARLVEDAREAAQRAIGIDPALGEAYAVLATLEGAYFGRWSEREALLDKALRAEPSTPQLLFRHGQFLVSLGRVAEGYAQQAKAFELDPLDPLLAAFHGYNVWARGSKIEGRAILNAAAERHPENVFVWFMRLNTAALEGDFTTAKALREEVARLVPGLAQSAVYKAGERLQELMMTPSPEAFLKLGEDFTAMAEAEPSAALDLAVALAVLGFTGPALEMFGEALDNVDAWRAGALETARPHIGYETALLFIDETRPMRMDANFAKLCVRLGLARYWRETDQWPDCVAETAAMYDFKGACSQSLA